MEKITNIKIKLKNGAYPLIKATPGSSGYDIHYNGNEDLILQPQVIYLVTTGVYMQMPDLTEAQVRSRSGLALKGVLVFNSPGTIDSDYRGEVKIMLRNFSDKSYTIDRYAPIAQIIFLSLTPVHLEYVTEKLTETERGKGGFGSTDIQSNYN